MILIRGSLSLLAAALLAAPTLPAYDYAYKSAEPQPTGWPLNPETIAYNTEKAEFERRPGAEEKKHLPKLWPVTPRAERWGTDEKGRMSYLKMHEGLVKKVQDNKGPCDVLLVGDSITIQWEQGLAGAGNSWTANFPNYKAVNIGIGGDKTYNVLWRLDHGGVDGLEPRSIVLMIGNNNMFFIKETGVEPVAEGIKTCVLRLRNQFTKTPIILSKILPYHKPGHEHYEGAKATNKAVDALKLGNLPQVQVIDLWNDFVNEDGTIKAELFNKDSIHLNAKGYEVYAKTLGPVLDKILVNAEAK